MKLGYGYKLPLNLIIILWNMYASVYVWPNMAYFFTLSFIACKIFYNNLPFPDRLIGCAVGEDVRACLPEKSYKLKATTTPDFSRSLSLPLNIFDIELDIAVPSKFKK